MRIPRLCQLVAPVIRENASSGTIIAVDGCRTDSVILFYFIRDVSLFSDFMRQEVQIRMKCLAV